jgi:cell division protein FtsB
MLEFDQKKKLKKFLYSPLMRLVLAVLVIFVARGAWNVYGKQSHSRESYERVVAEYEKLKERHTALVRDIEKLDTEQGKEEEIRKKFRLVKEGENIAIIVDESNKAPKEATTTEKGFWTSFKKLWQN